MAVTKMKSGVMGMVGAALMLSSIVACQETPHNVRNAVTLYQVGDFAAAENHLRPLITKKNEDFVLNNCRFGSCAIAAGDLNGANNSFLAAYEVINGVNTNSGGRTLGATLVFEGVKVWKGEPFERAMAHYYLGLTFLLQHDYENARAAFQNSLFKLREYAKSDDPKNFTAIDSSFALGYFLLGYTDYRLGKNDLAETNFNLAQKIDPRLAQTIKDVLQPGMNTLIFVDAGQGPRRAPKGWYNEESAFGPTPAEQGPVMGLAATADGVGITRSGQQYSMVDTLALAQEQQWQDIDTIRKTKAVIGTGAMVGGAGLTAYGAHERNAGLALAGVGVMALGAALAASSQADLRYWEMLPRTVYIIPAILPPGPHTVTVQAGYTVSAPLNVTISQSATTGTPQDNILYYRLR